MSVTRERGATERRFTPAHDLAARATSKHGNPADCAIFCSIDVPRPAQVVAAHVLAEAHELVPYSERWGISVRLGKDAGTRASLTINVVSDGESMRNHRSFAMTFVPHTESDACPSFEGYVRVEHVDAANSRVVAQGRYIDSTSTPILGEARSRITAEDALRQIVALLTADKADWGRPKAQNGFGVTTPRREE